MTIEIKKIMAEANIVVSPDTPDYIVDHLPSLGEMDLAIDEFHDRVCCDAIKASATSDQYKIGYKDGYDKGYDIGNEQGYDIGFEDGENGYHE